MDNSAQQAVLDRFANAIAMHVGAANRFRNLQPKTGTRAAIRAAYFIIRQPARYGSIQAAATAQGASLSGTRQWRDDILRALRAEESAASGQPRANAEGSVMRQAYGAWTAAQVADACTTAGVDVAPAATEPTQAPAAADTAEREQLAASALLDFGAPPVAVAVDQGAARLSPALMNNAFASIAFAAHVDPPPAPAHGSNHATSRGRHNLNLDGNMPIAHDVDSPDACIPARKAQRGQDRRVPRECSALSPEPARPPGHVAQVTASALASSHQPGGAAPSIDRSGGQR